MCGGCRLVRVSAFRGGGSMVAEYVFESGCGRVSAKLPVDLADKRSPEELLGLFYEAEKRGLLGTVFEAT